MSAHRILFSTPIFGFPPTGGPELRILNTIKGLARAAEITVQIRRPVSEEEMVLFERELGVLGCSAVQFIRVCAPREQRHRTISDYSRAIQNRIFKIDQRRALAQIRTQVSKDPMMTVWFGYGNISFSLIRNVRKFSPRAKIVCDTDSVWSRFLLRGVPYTTSVTERARLSIRGRKALSEETKMVALSTITTAVSEVDADYYNSLSKSKKNVQIVSNVIDIDDYTFIQESFLEFPAKFVCLTGSFGHEASPMDIAAKWMIEEVWPLVQERTPEAHLFIVGKNSDTMWNHRQSDTIHVTGRVPSTGPYIMNCDAVVVPLFFESGTRFKILEAGAYRKPVISTTLGAEGLSVTDGHDILIADTAVEFSNAIVETLLGEIKVDLGMNLHTLILRDYTLRNVFTQIKSILSILESKAQT